MSFTNSYRLERIYFEKLKDMINKLQPYLKEETDEKLKAILENSIDDNGAILLLYRNLGEAWAELSDLIKKADEKIDQTKEEAEKYHDELNQRIDEVNNYIMAIIRNLEETVADHERRIGDLEECCEEVQEALENKQDKLTPGIGIEIDENNIIQTNLMDISDRATSSVLKNLFTVSTERQTIGSGIYTYFYQMVFKMKLSATGAQLKEVLNGVKMIGLLSNKTLSATGILANINSGDEIEFFRRRVTVPKEFILFDRTLATYGVIKENQGSIQALGLSSHYNILGVENLINSLINENTYNFEISEDYILKYNNKVVSDLNGINGIIVDPDSYSVGTPICYLYT